MSKIEKSILTILIIIVSFLVGNFSSSYFKVSSLFFGNSISETRDMVKDNKQSDLSKDLPQVVQTKTIKYGEKFSIGGIEYQIISSVDKGSVYEYNKTSGKFILLTIKATNISQTEKKVSNILIVDSKNRQYKINSFAIDFSAKYNMYGNYDNYNGGIPAGLSQTFIAPFEVAKDSTGLKLIVPDTKGNILINIDLGL